MSNTELNKEILDILDNVIYWETCPKDYKVRIKAIKEQLTLTDVSQHRELLEAYDKFAETEHAWFIGTEKETKYKFLASNCG